MADHHRDNHQRQKQVVIQRHGSNLETEHLDGPAELDAEEGDAVDLVDALGAVGQVDRAVQVVEEDADDLAKTQGDDGQVVAAQLERGRAQQHTEQTGQRSGQRDDRPDGQVQAVRKCGRYPRKSFSQVRRAEQRKQIRAHGKESHVTQVEQAGVADHDVQAQRQQHVQKRHVQNAHPGVAALLQEQGQNQQGQRHQQKRKKFVCFHEGSPALRQALSATRSPSRPEGLSVSTKMSTMKAKMSEYWLPSTPPVSGPM